MTSREAQLTTLKADVEKGRETARKLPEFKKQVEELESRLSSLKAVLPDEKDAADLLRRMQTLATQSNLTITEFRPAAVVTKQLHAEWPITSSSPAPITILRRSSTASANSPASSTSAASM